MSDRIERCELVGLADPIEKKTGFLIPVFSHPMSNALLVEERDEDGRVAGFAPLQPQETKILDAPRNNSQIGEWPYWAFGLGGKTIVGQGDENRRELETALHGRFLLERPLLALEVAEFLGLHADRNTLANKIYEKMRRDRPDVADRWRDLAILTEDVNATLVRKKASQRDLSDMAALGPVTLRVEGRQVIVRGTVPGSTQSRSWALLRDIIENTLRDLRGLYEQASEGWNYRLPSSRGETAYPRSLSFDLSSLDALVYVADEGTPPTDPNLSARIDSIGVYPPGQSEQFIADSVGFEGPSFVGFLLDDAYGHIEPATMHYAQRRPLGLALRTKATPRLSRAETEALSRYPHPTIIITRRSPSGFTQNVISGELRDAVNLLSANTTERNRWSVPFDKSIFMRASGLGPDRSNDAWAQIYERCRKLGVGSTAGIAFLSESDRRPDAESDDIARLFFPDFTREQIPTSTKRKRRIDAAIIVDHLPSEGMGWNRHCKTIENITRLKGWEIRESAEAEHGQVYQLKGPSDRFELVVARGKPSDRRYSFEQIPHIDLGGVDRLILLDDANALTVLSHLESTGQLIVTPRDICAFAAKSGTVWTLYSYQLRRLSHWMSGKSRTHYLAMLCQSAIRRGNVDSYDSERFIAALSDEQLGDSIHLTSSNARFFPTATELRLKFSSRNSNSRVPSIFRDFDTFVLRVDETGPHLSQETQSISLSR
ncbi:hypothetical protein [Rhizobium sp. Root1204]|uniref:hypothetical protein n=1 Tax=Rhizobium sp. Root1204 TaxID=1736428 RepID=UPI000715701D|nr:hypothetical protein [Rhizobium sp. Root1204]KQV41230.1 hypothetical protein ASC96_18175 [Rhizobium sp. Root1204]